MLLRILLTKYWVLAHLLVTAGTLCFAPEPRAFQGLWCACSLLAMAMALPPVRRGETFWLARQRVDGSLRADIVLWSGLLALIWVGVALLNGPRALAYSAELKRWVYAAAPMAFLPSSVALGAGTGFWTGLLGGLSGAVVLRCVLPRSQRLVALLGLGALTGVLALGGVVAAAAAGAAPAWAWLGGAFDAGVLWFLLLCVCLGVVLESFLEGHWKTLVWALALALANGIGVVAFAPVQVLAMGSVAAAVYLCVVVVAVRGSGRYPRIMWYGVLALPVLFGAGLGLALGPARSLWMPEAWAAQFEAFFTQWSFRADLALQVWRSEPMLGVGPEGMGHFARFFVKGSRAWTLWRAAGSGVPCDFLRLLAERGMMGALLLLLPGAAMFGKCLMQWVEFRQSGRRHYSLRYIFVFAGAAVGVLGVLLASLVGTPLHTPAVLCVFVMVCATLSGWMPRLR